MRALFVSLSLVTLVACSEPTGVRAVPLGVSWLEWPAEVLANERFDVRTSGYLPACGSRFVPAYHADLSGVTLEPFAVVREPPPCVNVASASALEGIVQSMFDESIRVVTVGLGADTVRTYEMRATTYTSGGVGTRTFGDIVVRPDSVQNRRLNAAGRASAARDQAGCLRIYPVARVFSTSYPIENPPDTTSDWAAFVQGYLYEPATAVCGEAVVFHLVARN